LSFIRITAFAKNLFFAGDRADEFCTSAFNRSDSVFFFAEAVIRQPLFRNRTPEPL